MEIETKEDLEKAMYETALTYVESHTESNRLRAIAIGKGFAENQDAANKMWTDSLDRALDEKICEEMKEA